MHCGHTVLSCTASLIVAQTLAHRLLSSHRVIYPLSVQKMEWNRWHQNDWNHLQWFPQLPYLSTPLSLPTFLSSTPPPFTRSHRLDSPSQPLQCHPGSLFLPKRLRLTGSPMERHKVSQEEKESREENKEEKKGGGKWRQRFWCVSPPTNLKSF